MTTTTNKAQAKDAKAQAQAKAQAILAKQAQAKRSKQVEKLSDAILTTRYIYINNGADKLLENKTLVIKTRTLKDLKAKGYDIPATYSYNKDAIALNEMVETLKTLGYFIKDTVINN